MIAATIGAVAGAGCWDAHGELFVSLTDPKLATWGSGGSTSSSSSSGGTGGTPIVCIPSESKDPVAESCGVFVSSSLGVDDAAKDRGSQAKPFKTIGAALMKADVARVYACAESFTETVTISTAVDLYGGLACKGWAYLGATKKTTLTAAADAVPLTISGDAKIEDFAITAVDAKTDGGSSIAVIVDQAAASFARCDLVAGAGKAGLAGTTPTDSVGPTDPSNVAIKGNDGVAACMAMSSQLGGDAKENALCTVASGGPLGGAGGQGATLKGGNGDSTPPDAKTALGGQGEPAADPMWSCVVGQGAIGGNGTPGASGDGAIAAASLGTVDNLGYAGTPGQAGGPGVAGQGGGGGGGAKGKPLCAGASGGGGGAGGCGGKGGLGGTAGGASIVLVSLGATLTFDKVTIKSGVGGDGGNGGEGEGGGVGGDGGKAGAGASNPTPTLPACDGGNGGHGGLGGKGGGGRGGHAIGIAYRGAAMPSTKGATFTKGTPGKGGTGAADMMHDGDPGAQMDLQVFP